MPTRLYFKTTLRFTARYPPLYDFENCRILKKRYRCCVCDSVCYAPRASGLKMCTECKNILNNDI